jgi:hypothetical protein
MIPGSHACSPHLELSECSSLSSRNRRICIFEHRRQGIPFAQGGDKFERGATDEFVLGNLQDPDAQGNVHNEFFNDPREPYFMTVKSFDIFPTYLRFDQRGEDFWEAEEVIVTVRTDGGFAIRYEALKPVSGEYPNWIRLSGESGAYLHLRKVSVVKES